LCGLRCH